MSSEEGSSSSSSSSMWSKLMPDPPLLVAGGVGGPCVMLLVTPLRNALTIAATNNKASAGEIYGKVFKHGIRGGWTGGMYPMIPAVPQFCVIGPMFHVFKDIFGGSTSAGLLATATTETLISFGAETRNAQMASGVTKGLHNPLKPFGPGVAVHIARNAVAMSGFRLMSQPIRNAFGVKDSGGFATVTSDLVANLIASAVSMPLHQLYGYTVVTSAKQSPGTPAPSLNEKVVDAKAFLRRQFLVPGTNRLSSLALRDVVLRCNYNATIYTLYGFIERGCVSYFEDS